MLFLKVLVALSCIALSEGFHLSLSAQPRAQGPVTRRVLVQSSAAALASAAGVSLIGPQIAGAEVDDLSASDQPVPLTEQERIKRKLEAQAKINKVNKSGRQSYADSLGEELKRSKARKETKVQRGVDMCESLGRGC